MTKEKILDMFYENKGQLLSGAQLAKDLGVSRNAVWKAVSSLKEDGYRIDSVRNKGYMFLEHDDTLLSASMIKRNLSSKIVGRDLKVFDSLTSTNGYMQNQTGMKNGAVVIANEQENGRGRKNSFFDSPKGTGIYMSVFLKLSLLLDRISLLTLRIGWIVAECIAKNVDADVKIRWPNDILIGDKKVCGIMTNCGIEAESGMLEYAIVGIGIHVNDSSFGKDSFNTSLKEIAGHAVDRHLLIAQILTEIDKALPNLSDEEFDSIFLERLNSRLCYKGEEVAVVAENRCLQGKLMGVSADGALVLEREDGSMMTAKSGEIAKL